MGSVLDETNIIITTSGRMGESLVGSETQGRCRLLRIIYLHQYFNTPQMAGGIRSYEFAKRLVQRGHEVHMITSRRQPLSESSSDWVETNEAGIRVHWCDVPYSSRMTFRQRLRAFAQYMLKASAKAVTIPADVVFATSTPLTVAVPAIYSKKRLRIPMVFEVRDLWPEAPIAIGELTNPIMIKLARHLEKLAYVNSTRVVALSPGMKDGVVARGYPSEQVAVIPNAADIDLFRNRERKAHQLRQERPWLLDRPMILYAGALGKVNGVDYLARLAAKVKPIDPEVRFVVLGKLDGREAENVINTARILGVLDENFFVLPSVPKVEMAAWVVAADIATSVVINEPALWKNSANKFFDALAAGVPVGINYGGWQADVINESDAGLVMHPIDLDLAASQLLRVIHDQDWKKRAGQAALKLAYERYSRDILTDLLEEVLLSAVESK